VSVKTSLNPVWQRLPRPDRSNAGMWAIGAGHAMTHAYSAAWYLLVPFVARDLGLSYSQIGLLFAVRQFMSTVVNIPAGVIVDTLGRRDLFMALALLGSALPYLLISLTSSYWLIVVCVGLAGLASFLWHPAAITSISEMYPARRGYGIAIHELGANLGDTVMPLLTGLMLGYLTWRQVIDVNIVAGVLIAVFMLRVIARVRRRTVEPVARKAPAGDYLAGLRLLMRNTNLMLLALVSGIRSFSQQGLHTFLPLYLINQLRISAVVVGVYLSVVQVSGMIATPISGTLSDRIGPKRVATVGMFSTSLAVIGFALLDLGAAFVAALAVVGFFLYSMRPAVFRWAIGSVPREYEGTTVGALFTTQAAFSTFMPLLGGWVADRYGLIYVFYIIAGALVIANLMTLAVPDLKKPAPAQAE
jgi:FSR family fosmidomycin resistance protein-like MFS transporter